MDERALSTWATPVVQTDVHKVSTEHEVSDVHEVSTEHEVSDVREVSTVHEVFEVNTVSTEPTAGVAR